MGLLDATKDILRGGLPEVLDFPNASDAPQPTRVQFTERQSPTPDPEDKLRERPRFDGLLTSPIVLGAALLVFGGLVVWGLRK